MASVKNPRDLRLQGLSIRTTAVSIAASSDVGSITKTRDGEAYSSTYINLSAVTSGVSSPKIVVSYSTSSGGPFTDIYTQTGSTSISYQVAVSDYITTHKGSSSVVYYKLSIYSDGTEVANDKVSIPYIEQTDSTYLVERTNSSASVLAYSTGIPTGDYANTGNIIRVLKGTTYLVYEASGNTPNTFYVETSPTITPIGGVTLGTYTGTATTGCTVSNIVSMSTAVSSTSVTWTVKVRDSLGNTLPENYSAYQVFTKLTVGDANVQCILSNPAFTIPTDSVGGNANYSGSGTDVRVYEGTTLLNYDGVGTSPSTFRITCTGTNLTVGTITDNGAYATLGTISAMTADTGRINITAIGTASNGSTFSIEGVQTFAKVKSADSPIVYKIVAPAAINRDNSNTFIPSTITFSAVYGTGASPYDTFTSGYWTVDDTTDGTNFTNSATASGATTTYTPVGTTIKAVRARLYTDSGRTVLVDSEVIPITIDGINTINIVLSNQAIAIPTNSAGTVTTYANSSAEIYVYQGSSQLTYDGIGSANGTFTVTTAGVNITPGSLTDSGTYATLGTASAMTADTAKINITATGKTTNGASFTLYTTQYLSKNKSSENTPVYKLIAPASVKRDISNTYTPNPVTFQSIMANGLSNYGSYQGSYWTVQTTTDGVTYSDVTYDASEPNWSNVVLLMHMNNTNGSTSFIDEKGKVVTANGNAAHSVTQSKFGGSSLYLDGNADWLSIPYSTDFNFGTGDFTVEAWINTTDNNFAIMDSYTSSAAGSWQFMVTASGYLQWYAGSGAIVTATSGAVNNGTWQHVAACRASSTTRLYANGTKVAEIADSKDYTNAVSTTFAIGAQVQSRNATYDLLGYVDEVRITKGLARYTGTTLTVPTSPFPDPSYIMYTLSGNTIKAVRAKLFYDSLKTVLLDDEIVPVTVDGNSGAMTYRVYYKASSKSSPPSTPSNTTDGTTPASWSSAPYTGLTGTEAQFISDGTQAANSTTTVWSTPYLSYFNTASLSEVSTDTGTLNITGTISASTTSTGVVIATDRISAKINTSSTAAIFGEGTAGSHGVRGYAADNGSGVSEGIVGHNTGYAFKAIQGTSGPFTGSHDILLDPNEVIEVGDIITDVEVIFKRDVSNTICKGTKSTQPAQKGPIGVLATKPVPLSTQASPPAAFIDGSIFPNEGYFGIYDEIKSLYKVAIVNAIGEGQINVCGQNGNIEIGDLIITSNLAGKGMKQSDDIIRGYTVAKSRERVVFSSSSEVKMISCIYLCG